MFSRLFSRLLPGILAAWAINGACQEPVVAVWPGVAPGSESWSQQEVETNFGDQRVVRNVSRPSLIAYLPAPEKAVGSAVIVCPGGGFVMESIDSEGTEVAKWLRDRGVAAFVLKYRLTDTGASDKEFRKAISDVFSAALKHPLSASGQEPEILQFRDIKPLAIADGLQAIRVVRQRAAEWNIDPHRIGIIGFSAGAVVATGTALQYDAASRPDLVGAIYGPADKSITVPADAPPLFLLSAADDPLVTPSASIGQFQDWRKGKHSAELHIYSKGGHGFGMGKKGMPTDGWIERYGDWLRGAGFLSVPVRQ